MSLFEKIRLRLSDADLILKARELKGRTLREEEENGVVWELGCLLWTGLGACLTNLKTYRFFVCAAYLNTIFWSPVIKISYAERNDVLLLNLCLVYDILEKRGFCDLL